MHHSTFLVSEVITMERSNQQLHRCC